LQFGSSEFRGQSKEVETSRRCFAYGGAFELLDKAKLAPATILKTGAQKEHFETLLMFAFRKRQAARSVHLATEEIMHTGKWLSAICVLRPPYFAT
jgi:hypothetical protein